MTTAITNDFWSWLYYSITQKRQTAGPLFFHWIWLIPIDLITAGVCVRQGQSRGRRKDPIAETQALSLILNFPHWESLKGLGYRIMFIHLYFFFCCKQQNILCTEWRIRIVKSGRQDYFTAYGKGLPLWIWEVASIMLQGLDKANKSQSKWKHLSGDRSATAYTAIGSLQSLCNRSWG